VLAAIRCGHQQLFSHSLRSLEAHLSAAGEKGGGAAVAAAAAAETTAGAAVEAAEAEAAVAAAAAEPAAAATATMLKNILLTAINDRSSSSPASLQALLASRLPFHLAALGGSLHSLPYLVRHWLRAAAPPK
jgi:hypothetical protein